MLAERLLLGGERLEGQAEGHRGVMNELSRGQVSITGMQSFKFTSFHLGETQRHKELI